MLKYILKIILLINKIRVQLILYIINSIIKNQQIYYKIKL